MSKRKHNEQQDSTFKSSTSKKEKKKEEKIRNDRCDWLADEMEKLIFEGKLIKTYYDKHGMFLSKANKILISLIITSSSISIIYPLNTINIIILSISTILV